MLRVWSDVLTSADVWEVTLLGLLDLSAAFDCVDHGFTAKTATEKGQLKKRQRKKGQTENWAIGKIGNETGQHKNNV